MSRMPSVQQGQRSVELNNGISMPRVGFGVFQVPAEEVATPVRTALEAGYRLIDTAAAYGNEEGVGRALAQSGLDRDEIFVTTKVWNADQGFENTLAAFDRSRTLLGLDTVDLYLIHWPAPALAKFKDTWRALEKLYAEGKVRAIGVSNFTTALLDELATTADVVPAVNQVELHPLLPQTDLRDFHEAHGIVTQAWSPLARGRLLEDVRLAEIAARHDVGPAQVVLRWHLQHGTTVIPKSVTPSRIAANLDVWRFELSEDELATIESLETGERVGSHPDTMNKI